MAALTLKGPWKGMDLRETDAEEGTYALGINVDVSQGTIQARPPWKEISVGGRGIYPVVTLFDCPPFAVTILAASLGGSGGSGGTVTATDGQSLADLGSASLPDPSFVSDTPRVYSWVQAYLNDSGVAVPVALLVTEYATYVYDPRLAAGDAAQMRALSPATDAFKVNAVNYSYWASVPRGPIAVMHQTRVYYAGFNQGVAASLDNPVPVNQGSKLEAILSASRAEINLNPSMFYWSDESDPAGIRADHFIQVGFGETITGMNSTGEVLLIFTDRNIYALTGYSDDTFQLSRVVTGTGCVSHQSIVTESGVTYFASQDGIYAFGGLGAPEAIKLTDGLQQLWTGWTGQMDNLPDPMRTRLQATLGWPWTFNPARFAFIQGRVCNSRDFLAWCMPVAGAGVDVFGELNEFRCLLVYDLKRRGWNIWTMSNGDNIYDMAEVAGRVLGFGSNGTLAELLPTATFDGGSSDGVPMYWVSQRLAPAEDEYRQCRSVRFKVLSTGVFATGQGGSPVTVGSDAVPLDLPMACIEGEEASWDMVDDAGTANDYTERITRTAAFNTKGTTALHPNPAGSAFFGSAVWGTDVWTPLDWFTSRLDVNITSRWFRIGIIDDPYTAGARSNAVNCASITLELGPPESPNR
jgi:hypothetical protein